MNWFLSDGDDNDDDEEGGSCEERKSEDVAFGAFAVIADADLISFSFFLFFIRNADRRDRHHTCACACALGARLGVCLTAKMTIVNERISMSLTGNRIWQITMRIMPTGKN